MMAPMAEPPLTLLSSMATRELLAELVSRYQRDTGREVSAQAAGGVDVAQRVAAGEAVDVVALAAAAIDKLVAHGSVRDGTRRDLAKSGMAIAVTAGASRPDISTAAAVREAVLAAPAIGYSTGPSGLHLEKLLAGWGILETLRPRIVIAPPGVPVGSLVADGRVALGFQQQSELMNVGGIEVLGPLPAAIQSITVFSAGITTRCGRPDAARELIDYLSTPATAPIKRSFGMEAI